MTANKVLHVTAIPLGFIAAGKLCVRHDNLDSFFLRSVNVSSQERYRNHFSSFEFKLSLSTSTFS